MNILDWRFWIAATTTSRRVAQPMLRSASDWGRKKRENLSTTPQGAPPIRFCETNPFYFRGLFATSHVFTVTYAVCSHVCKWVRSGKTNPFWRGYGAIFIEKWVRFRGMRRRKRPTTEMLRQAQHDRMEEEHAVYNGCAGDGKRCARPTITERCLQGGGKNRGRPGGPSLPALSRETIRKWH